MINAGADFAEAVSRSSRRFRMKLYYGNTEVSGTIKSAKVHLGSTGPKSFSIGAVYSAYAEIVLDGRNTELEGKELRLDAGILTDAGNNTYVDITLGYFTALTPAATKYRTTFTAVGRITSKLAVTEFIAPSSQTLANIASAITRQTGVLISFAAGIDTSGMIEYPVTGNCRDALTSIAIASGGYAIETNTGGILVSRFSSNASSASYGPDTMQVLPEIADYDFEVTGVQAITPTGLYEEGDSINVVIDSNYVTEDLFDDFAGDLIGFSYRPGTASLALGDPRIEPTDVLEISTPDDETYVMPCLAITHIFDGGFQTEVITPAVQEVGEVSGTLGTAVKEAAQKAEDAAVSADDARKVAIHYLARDNTGIMVADMSGGTAYTPSTVPEGIKNTYINDDSFNVRDGLTVLASFGESESQIGTDDGTHIIIGSDEVLGSYLRMLNGDDIVFDVNDTYLKTSNGRAGVRMDYGPDDDPLIGIYYNQTIKVELRYNKTSNKGEIRADYAQFTDAYIDHALTVYTAGGFIDLMGDSNSNRGLYDEPSASWIIRRNDLGVILGKLAGSISVDKTDITSASTAEVTVIGSQGKNQISLFANNHNGHNAGLFDHGNSQWVLEYNNQSGWVKILGAQIKEGASQNVANNLSTTAAGSVLDARQGKALSDMLTAEAYDFNASSYSKLVNNAVVSRVGKLGILFLSSLTGLSANADTDLGITIPAKYRPTRGIVQDCIVAGATPACLRVTISTAGKVTVHNYTTSTGTMNIRARIPYICAGT